jgi:K(+)-stimulated pyrophosphate-energized sodium pump
MVIASLGSFYVNKAVSTSLYGNKKDFNWEAAAHEPGLADLHRFHRGRLRRQQILLGFRGGDDGRGDRHAVFKSVVGAGRHRRLRHAGRPLIMEFTKIFVSTKSRHVKEIVTCSGQGGASLNILSGFVAGNFCAFWMGWSSSR